MSRVRGCFYPELAEALLNLQCGAPSPDSFAWVAAVLANPSTIRRCIMPRASWVARVTGTSRFVRLPRTGCRFGVIAVCDTAEP